jgi:hypothetical protein
MGTEVEELRPHLSYGPAGQPEVPQGDAYGVFIALRSPPATQLAR